MIYIYFGVFVMVYYYYYYYYLGQVNSLQFIAQNNTQVSQNRFKNGKRSVLKKDIGK